MDGAAPVHSDMRIRINFRPEDRRWTGWWSSVVSTLVGGVLVAIAVLIIREILYDPKHEHISFLTCLHRSEKREGERSYSQLILYRKSDHDVGGVLKPGWRTEDDLVDWPLEGYLKRHAVLALHETYFVQSAVADEQIFMTLTPRVWWAPKRGLKGPYTHIHIFQVALHALDFGTVVCSPFDIRAN